MSDDGDIQGVGWVGSDIEWTGVEWVMMVIYRELVGWAVTASGLEWND